MQLPVTHAGIYDAQAWGIRQFYIGGHPYLHNCLISPEPLRFIHLDYLFYLVTLKGHLANQLPAVDICLEFYLWVYQTFAVCVILAFGLLAGKKILQILMLR